MKREGEVIESTAVGGGRLGGKGAYVDGRLCLPYAIDKAAGLFDD